MNASPRLCSGVVCGLLVLTGWPAQLCADASDFSDRMFVLTVDMTKDGKRVAPPTPEQPAYYVPIFTGYKELGEIEKHYERPPPSEDDVQQSLVAALARQHYLLASHEHPPSLVVVFEWGTIAPVRMGAGRRANQVANASEIRAYVLGTSTRDVVGGYAGYKQEMSSLTARHFLLISAFLYQGKGRKEETLLWRAHSTTDAWENYLDEILKPLIATVTPALGRETKPGVNWNTAVPHVIIGTPEVKDFPAAPAKLH